MNINNYLPISKKDMEDRGWDELDFIVITGDAYVDHPSFGIAIISRVLENAGYKVGIIAQPNWRTEEDFKKLGKPRLAFLISAGNIDSMVNHYTVSKHRRKKDFYSPGAKTGLRPDRATIVYSKMIRQIYKKIPIVIGGLEASLRRFAHYDYWSDKVRQSFLMDSDADLLIYGMGEKQILELADNLNNGLDIKYIRHIPGTCYKIDSLENVYDYIELPSFRKVADDKKSYSEAFKIQYDEHDPIRGKTLVQKHKSTYLVQNPPMGPLNQEELDWVYSLPYQKNYHPSYEPQGGVPAITEVRFSLVSARGCFGSCNFCAITFHQGRFVQSRSHESILEEAKELTALPDFKGYIHDLGGPTANFRSRSCEKQMKSGTCKNKMCLYPNPCKNLTVDHEDFISILRKVRELPKVKKVFVRSGIRYDYVMADRNDNFLKELCEHHVSGQLKVAPEHISQNVLKYMGKPKQEVYEAFRNKFYKINREIGKEQYIIPYLISSHPGSTLKDAILLAEYLRDTNYRPEQVQDFYPTPGTISTCMFYTGYDPRTNEKVYVPKNPKEKAMQRALLQYTNPKNYDLVYEALLKENRQDLIGFDKKCLIKPKNSRKNAKKAELKSNTNRHSQVKEKFTPHKSKGRRKARTR